MSEHQTVATPAASVPRDTQVTANNIAKGISERARGKSPVEPKSVPEQDNKPVENKSETPVPDPNAGKEKYIVEGKEVWLTPQERTTWIQKGLAFEPRMDQLARLAQEQSQFVRALINDPLTVLKNVSKQQNIPISSLYEKILDGDWPEEVKEIIGKKYYHNAVEPLQLTPEQLKAREDAKWRQNKETQEKMQAEQAIRRENQAKFQAAFGNLKANIAEAMKDSGLPDNDTPLGAEMARMVADAMRVAYFRRQSLTPKQAIENVKRNRIVAFQNAYYQHLKGKELVEALGDPIVNELKNYLFKVAQERGNPIPNVSNGRKPMGRNRERETMNLDQFHESLEQYKK